MTATIVLGYSALPRNAFSECWRLMWPFNRGSSAFQGRQGIEGHPALAPDANPPADPHSLGRCRQPVEMQTALIFTVLIETAETEPLLHEAPMAGRLCPDTDQIAVTIAEDMARRAVNRPIATSVTPQGERRGIEGSE